MKKELNKFEKAYENIHLFVDDKTPSIIKALLSFFPITNGISVYNMDVSIRKNLEIIEKKIINISKKLELVKIDINKLDESQYLDMVYLFKNYLETSDEFLGEIIIKLIQYSAFNKNDENKLNSKYIYEKIKGFRKEHFLILNYYNMRHRLENHSQNTLFSGEKINIELMKINHNFDQGNNYHSKINKIFKDYSFIKIDLINASIIDEDKTVSLEKKKFSNEKEIFERTEINFTKFGKKLCQTIEIELNKLDLEEILKINF
jgi:hypothetical protein